MKRTSFVVSLVLAALVGCGTSPSTAEPAAESTGNESTAAAPSAEPAAAPEASPVPSPVPVPPPVAAAPVETKLPTLAVVVSHKVKDFDAWKTAFEGHQAARKDAGIVAHHINRGIVDPNFVVVYLVATDLEKLKTFLADPALKATMKTAGVIGKPALEIVTPVENRTATDATLPAAIVTHDVKDYDAWKTAFDSDSQARTDAGLVGYSLNRGEGKPNHIMLYTQSKTREALETFLASPELKAKMKTAGVKGKPTITLVQGVEWGQYTN